MVFYLKKYGFIVFAFMLLLCIFFFNVHSYLKNANKHELSYEQLVVDCTSSEISKEMNDYCDEALKYKPYEKNFFIMFYTTYCQGFNFILFFMFILITIPTVVIMCNFMKNNIFKIYLTRTSYKKTILNLFLDAYKPALLLPVLTIVAFVVCIFCTKNFDYLTAANGNYVSWNIESMENPFLFMIVYFFKILLVSLLYTNISLIVCRKNHNFIVSAILSFLYFIAVEVFLEVVCNMVISNYLFNSQFGMVFNIFSIFSLFDYYGLLYSIVIPFILFIISSFLVYLMYKNKEKLLIDCEKNI